LQYFCLLLQWSGVIQQLNQSLLRFTKGSGNKMEKYTPFFRTFDFTKQNTMVQKLQQSSLLEESKTLKKRYEQLNHLIDEINKKHIPESLEKQFSESIQSLNAHSGTAKLLSINMRRAQIKITRTLEKELKMVPKNHYRNIWMAIGMSAFGVSMGVGFGIALDNMAYIGIGIPIGMVIGMAIGSGMDKKAAEEGRQLNIIIEL
jgi:hypothetical protein